MNDDGESDARYVLRFCIVFMRLLPFDFQMRMTEIFLPFHMQINEAPESSAYAAVRAELTLNTPLWPERTAGEWMPFSWPSLLQGSTSDA